MSYNPNFSRPAQGNFSADKSFSQVRIGTDAYLLEDELNEMQAILREQTRDVVRQIFYDGVLNIPAITKDATRANVVRIAPFEAILDGIKVKVAGINTTGTARQAADGEDNLILFSTPPDVGWRTDAVILEVSEREVSGDSTLYRLGAVGSDFKMPSDLIDARIGAETARRMQLQSRLLVLEGVDPFASTYKIGTAVYKQIPSGSLRSDAGQVAILLCSVDRLAGEPGLAVPDIYLPLAKLKDLLYNGSITTDKITFSAVTTDKIANGGITADKIATSAVTTTKIADGGITADKIATSAVTTEKIANGSIRADKIADQHVTFAKLSSDAISQLHVLQGLGVPSDPTYGFYGFNPVLRFFNWWGMSSPMPLSWSPRFASEWGNSMLDKHGEAWRFFSGVEFMVQPDPMWFDKNVQLTSNGGDCYADNVSVICLRNTSDTDQPFNLNVYYSSAGGNNINASASVAWYIFNPANKPALTGKFLNVYEKSANMESFTNFEALVPAGHVIIFVLKTSPNCYANNANTYWYNNYHGLRPWSNRIFTPHIETYRRLLTGTWN